MKYKIEKNTVQETLILPLYSRKLCTELYPNLYRDETAVRLLDQIDYDFSQAEKNSRSLMQLFGALEVAMRQNDLMIWKRMLPLKNTAQRILASFCNPIVFTGIVGNLFTLLPWPLDQIDHGTESAGHLLVLVLGLILLREMAKCGECKETVQ